MSDSSAWWEARFEVPNHLSEELGAAVIYAGALGVQTLTHESPLPRLPDIHGNPPEPMELDLSPEHDLLICCFAPELSETDIRRLLRECLPSPAKQIPRDVTIELQNDTSWQTMWKAFFTPRKIGARFWVVPSWERDFELPPGDHAIVIDPGMAFGTGHHATTALCLAALEQALLAPSCSSVLDVGCGSGILSIAAGLLGAPEIMAIDIDAKAVEVTRENAAINQLTQVQAATTPVDEISKSYTLVVANILANILVSLAHGIVAALSSRSTLLLSGIPGHQIQEVHDTFNAAFQALRGGDLPTPKLTQEGEWACLLYSIEP